MRTETYLRAYFACRDRLEFVRLDGKVRRRRLRQVRKLEGRLFHLAVLQAEEERKSEAFSGECRKEKSLLWFVVLCQLAVLVFLALAKIARPWI